MTIILNYLIQYIMTVILMNDIVKLNFGQKGLHINAELSSGYNMFMGDAGTGKSCFFNKLHSYCTSNNIPVKHITYNNISDINYSDFKIKCKESKFVIFDNGDLYLTQGLLEDVISDDNIILFSVKTAFPYLRNVAMRSVKFDGCELVVF